MTREEKAEQLREIGSERILVKDGPYGSMIQSYRLDEAGYRGSPQFKDKLGSHDQKGNNDLLNLTRPDVVGEICNAYLDAGADIVATNTFNSNAISLSDYGITGMAREINIAAAKLARFIFDLPCFVGLVAAVDDCAGILRRSPATTEVISQPLARELAVDHPVEQDAHSHAVLKRFVRRDAKAILFIIVALGDHRQTATAV